MVGMGREEEMAQEAEVAVAVAGWEGSAAAADVGATVEAGEGTAKVMAAGSTRWACRTQKHRPTGLWLRWRRSASAP